MNKRMKQLVCIKLFNEGLSDFLKCFFFPSFNWVVRTKFIKPEKRKLPLATNIKMLNFRKFFLYPGRLTCCLSIGIQVRRVVPVSPI